MVRLPDDPEPLVEIKTPECMVCGEPGKVKVPERSYYRWRSAMATGDPTRYLSMLSAGEREQLVSGVHPSCWEELFPEGIFEKEEE